MADYENGDNRFSDVMDKIRGEWDGTTDKTKDGWDNLVDKIVDRYRDSADWTDDKINEAKGYFKGRYDSMK